MSLNPTKKCLICEAEKPTEEIHWGVCKICLDTRITAAADRLRALREDAKSHDGDD